VIAAEILARPALDTWWLDHGRRNHRLHRSGGWVVAEHRDGRAFRVPWPTDEPVPGHEAFARQIFEILAKADAGPATGARP